jgi:hypothetical protein
LGRSKSITIKRAAVHQSLIGAQPEKIARKILVCRRRGRRKMSAHPPHELLTERLPRAAIAPPSVYPTKLVRVQEQAGWLLRSIMWQYSGQLPGDFEEIDYICAASLAPVFFAHSHASIIVVAKDRYDKHSVACPLA